MKKFQLETIEAYNKSVDSFFQTIGKLDNYNVTYDYIISKIHKFFFILDLACGTENISKYILNHKKVNITGFDLSTGMLEIAKKNIPCGNFYKKSIIKFKTQNKFDLIINGFGIPYLDFKQIRSCFKSSYNVLK